MFAYLRPVNSSTRFSLCPLIAVAVALLAARSGFAQGDALTPESILQKTEQAYRELNSYSDTGVANYRNPDGSERLSVTFRMWFARPSAFRLDAESKAPASKSPRREVMWTDGSVVRTWATDKTVSSQSKVQIAGSGMFGTYAYHVPTLLEASYGGERRIHNLNAPKLVGEESFEGTDCYRIAGEWQGAPHELWIRKSDHLIRKLVAKYRDHEMEEIHRDVVPNAAIPLEVFRFAPEKEAASPAKK